MSPSNTNSLPQDSQEHLNITGSGSVLNGRKNVAPSLASSHPADMTNASLDSDDSQQETKERQQEVNERQQEAKER